MNDLAVKAVVLIVFGSALDSSKSKMFSQISTRITSLDFERSIIQQPIRQCPPDMKRDPSGECRYRFDGYDVTDKPGPYGGATDKPGPYGGATDKPSPYGGATDKPGPYGGATDKPYGNNNGYGTSGQGDNNNNELPYGQGSNYDKLIPSSNNNRYPNGQEGNQYSHVELSGANNHRTPYGQESSHYYLAREQGIKGKPNEISINHKITNKQANNNKRIPRKLKDIKKNIIITENVLLKLNRKKPINIIESELFAIE